MATPRTSRSPVISAARTIGALLALQAVLPLNAAVTGAALAVSPLRRPSRTTAPQPKTVLISGGKMTKALQLARSFHQAGHRVVLVETEKYRLTGHRFSRAVDAFHVVPDPRSADYAAALLRIVQDERVDVYVPVCSPVASWYDAKAAELLRPHCDVVHCDADMVATLDDKASFASLAASLGLDVPDSHRITSPSQVAAFDFTKHAEAYILKSIAYDPVQRLDLTRLPLETAAQTAAFAQTKPVSPDNPWIMQAFISGQEWCTHSTVRDGQVQLHCCCRSSPFQVNYEHVDHPAIEAWVTTFVGALGLTGQVSFDFIEDADGRVYAIECNPRTHSAITMLYDNPDVARAYLDHDVPTVRATQGSRPTYWIYHEVWRLITEPRHVPHRLRTIARGKDAIFEFSDPLPFLLEHHLQIPALLISNLRRGKDWLRIDFNIGKLVEPAGD
jgi:predicted ATP-grasp superfamily ATP-dependent carboligase